MNEEQIKGMLRTLIATFGGGIAGWFVAKGWFTADQVMAALNSPAFIGIVVSVVSGIWSLFAHTKTNQVAIVNAIPEVKGVVMQPTLAGKNLAESVASSKPHAATTVAPAGTTQAHEIAKK